MAGAGGAVRMAHERPGRGREESGHALDVAATLREIGGAATWTLSSAKAGFGVEQLRDDSVDTYWQSDGQQPHTVTVQFPRKMEVELVALYLDFGLDESYTPSRLSLRAGTGLHDLQEVKAVELAEPKGWVQVPLSVRANALQLVIVANHQNGRDSHVRLMRVFGARPAVAELLRQPLFADPDLAQYAQLR